MITDEIVQTYVETSVSLPGGVEYVSNLLSMQASQLKDKGGSPSEKMKENLSLIKEAGDTPERHNDIFTWIEEN